MKKKLVMFLLLAVFSVSLILAVTGVSGEIEVKFAGFINPNASKNIVMHFFTVIGEAYTVIGIVVLLLILPSRLKIGIPVAAATVCSWLANTAIKNLVCRARPDGMLLEVSGYSFPSGHAMNSAALYTAIAICVIRLCRTSRQRAAAFLILLLPVFIAASRVYFNVHYLTDVVAGLSLGAFTALLVCPAVLKFIDKRIGGKGNAVN